MNKFLLFFFVCFISNSILSQHSFIQVKEIKFHKSCISWQIESSNVGFDKEALTVEEGKFIIKNLENLTILDSCHASKNASLNLYSTQIVLVNEGEDALHSKVKYFPKFQSSYNINDLTSYIEKGTIIYIEKINIVYEDAIGDIGYLKYIVQ